MIRNSPSDADHGRVPDPVTERPRPSTGPPQKFQWGWLSRLFGVSQPTPVVSPLPVLLVGVVFGLAMDYQVFLVTSIREEHSHLAPPARAVVTGFAQGARGRHRRRHHHDQRLRRLHPLQQALAKSIDFALAAAVFFDAFIVRMSVVLAVMAPLGRAA